MGSLERRIFVSLLLGVAVVVGFGLYADVSKLGRSFAAFDGRLVLVALALASGNYGVRFVKWHYYLGRIGVQVKPARSLGIFLSGLAMSVTPGKLGELLKSYLLRTSNGVPLAVSAPVVLAERLTDFIALILLCVGGVASSRYGMEVVVVATVLVFSFVAIVSMRRVSMALIRGTSRLPGLRKITHRLEHAYESMVRLVMPRPLVVGVVLSVAAWYLECIAFYVILTGFSGVEVTVGKATFIYAFATIAGAITMLPGGLIATEGSMIALLYEVFHVAPTTTVATASTLIVRFCTLWFAVLVGFVSVALLRRSMKVDPPLARVATSEGGVRG